MLITFLADVRVLATILIGSTGLILLLNATPLSRPYVRWIGTSALLFGAVNVAWRAAEMLGWVPERWNGPIVALLSLMAWAALIVGMDQYLLPEPARQPARARRTLGLAVLLFAAVVGGAVVVLHPWRFAGPAGIALLMCGTMLWLTRAGMRRRWPGLVAMGLLMLLHPFLLVLAWGSGLSLEQFRQVAPMPVAAIYMMATAMILQGDSRLLHAELAARAQAEASLQALADSLELQVKERTRGLEQLVSGLTSFAGMVSHDLRGPLGNVRNLASLARQAQRQGEQEKLAHWLGLLEQEGERAQAMVGDLLVLARADQAPPRLEDVDLGALVDECVAALAHGHERAPAVVRHADLPRLRIDRGMFRHALLNLLGNALKYGAARADLRIEVSARREGQAWCVRVQDNGPGFEPGQEAQLFRPFVRLPGATATGTGLGLMVVRRVVEIHGGQVGAQALAEGGACFWWTLPASADCPAPSARPA